MFINVMCGLEFLFAFSYFILFLFHDHHPCHNFFYCVHVENNEIMDGEVTASTKMD